MKFANIFNDKDAVSPVIGVILMVAITVILAAVIGTFVLGLGDQVSNTAPTASFTFDYSDSAGGGQGQLSITHDGGDQIAAPQTIVSTQSTTLRHASNDTTYSTTNAVSTTSAKWGQITTASTVSAGSTVNIEPDTGGALSGATVRIVWESSNGGDTATLGKWTGPDA